MISILTLHVKRFSHCSVITQRRFDTHWVGGERPALPQNAHCWLKTTERDRPKPSPMGGEEERGQSRQGLEFPSNKSNSKKKINFIDNENNLKMKAEVCHVVT